MVYILYMNYFGESWQINEGGTLPYLSSCNDIKVFSFFKKEKWHGTKEFHEKYDTLRKNANKKMIEG